MHQLMLIQLGIIQSIYAVDTSIRGLIDRCPHTRSIPQDVGLPVPAPHSVRPRRIGHRDQPSPLIDSQGGVARDAEAAVLDLCGVGRVGVRGWGRCR